MMFLLAVGILAICLGSSALAWRFGRMAGAREAVLRLDTVLFLDRQAELIGVSPEERIRAVENVLKIDRHELNAGLPFKQRIQGS